MKKTAFKHRKPSFYVALWGASEFRAIGCQPQTSG